MLPQGCEAWEYKDYPGAKERLKERAERILLGLRSGTRSTKDAALETRPSHAELFEGLTPACCSCYAGNYRGSAHRCLKEYPVGIKSDPRVGAPPALVAWHMRAFTAKLSGGLQAIDAGAKSPTLTTSDRRANAIALACALFELFLRIHPYANGNGHAARLLLVAVLGRNGCWPRQFAIDPRPPEPHYSEAIRASRDGNRAVLEQFVSGLL
jgi:hypothetical protein